MEEAFEGPNVSLEGEEHEYPHVSHSNDKRIFADDKDPRNAENRTSYGNN